MFGKDWRIEWRGRVSSIKRKRAKREWDARLLDVDGEKRGDSATKGLLNTSMVALEDEFVNCSLAHSFARERI